MFEEDLISIGNYGYQTCGTSLLIILFSKQNLSTLQGVRLLSSSTMSEIFTFTKEFTTYSFYGFKTRK